MTTNKVLLLSGARNLPQTKLQTITYQSYCRNGTSHNITDKLYRPNNRSTNLRHL